MYRTIFELSPEAIVLLDRRGRFLAANGRLKDWLGYSPDDLLGTSILRAPFMPRTSKATIVRNFLRRMAGRSIPPYELAFTTRSGKTRYGRVHATAVSDADGHVSGDLVMISDVTELRSVQEDLVERSDELAERVKELTCFHEISKLAIDRSLSLEELVRGVAELIPDAMRFPEVAAARVHLGGFEHATDGFETSGWLLSHEVLADGKTEGAIDVCYSRRLPVDGQDVFLDEERMLIATIAERLGYMVSRMRAERALSRSEARSRAMLNATSDFMLLLDREGNIQAANDSAVNLLGRSQEELVGTDISTYFPDEVASRRREVVVEAVRTASPVVTEDEDRGRIYSSRVYPIAGDDGRVEQLAIFSRDVTESKAAEREVTESRLKIEGLHEAARQLEGCSTRDEICQATIEAARDVLGFSVCVVHMAIGESLVVRTACSDLPPGVDLDESPTEDSAAMRAFKEDRTVVATDGGGSACSRCPELFRSSMCVPIDGAGVFEVLSTEADAFDDEDVRLLELLLGHTTEALRGIGLREELAAQAVRDPLTGLFNRRYLSNITEQEIERARRYGHRIGFLMVDVDNFKKINDTLGHQVGDLVLRQVARFLRAMVRATEFVVRYGGDEFLLVMPESGGEGESIIFRLQRAFGPWSEELPTRDIPVRLSMGFDVWEPAGGRSVDDVIASADEKMYSDKRRNAVVASLPRAEVADDEEKPSGSDLR